MDPNYLGMFASILPVCMVFVVAMNSIEAGIKNGYLIKHARVVPLLWLVLASVLVLSLTACATVPVEIIHRIEFEYIDNE